MSKPKKPAEDKSKAGAVTNSIADEIDEIIEQALIDAGCIGPFDEPHRCSWLHCDHCGVCDMIFDLKSALLTLIADRERKARIDELKSLKPKKVKGAQLLEIKWIDKRILALQAEDKES